MVATLLVAALASKNSVAKPSFRATSLRASVAISGGQGRASARARIIRSSQPSKETCPSAKALRAAPLFL
ncbi:UNVERIFIED_CONTAM: hypothetical protein GTU68_044155 [Idotea baltica]|nr:hypothetical protein [Idotea baltica]